MKIQTKLAFLTVLCLGIFAIAFFFYMNLEKSRLSTIFHETKNEKNTVFDKLLTLKGAPLEMLANDYTYWDEMVDFISTRDLKWAQVNIDFALPTFQVNAVWIYDTNFTLLYSINDVKESSLKELPFTKEEFDKLFAQSRLRHFFINTAAGLMEIRGATIHPTADSKRETPPRGYFLAGRLWNKEFLSELSNLMDGRLTLLPFFEEKTNPTLKNLSEKGIINLSKILTDFDHRPLMAVNMSIDSETMRVLKRSSTVTLFTVVFLIAAAFSLLIALLNRWVSLPLHLISRTLETGNISHISSMQNEEAEFGDISRLIQRAFSQKEALIKEIAERKKAEARFQHVADAAEEWIWEVDKDGLYIYSNTVVERILGYKLDEIIGKKHFYDFSIPGHEEKLKKEAFAIFAAKKDFKNFLNENRHKNGSIVYFETSGSPVLDKQGNLLGYRGVDTDITERKKAEVELKNAYEKLKETQGQLIQAEKLNAVGQLASGVAHEVRNPLGIIIQGVNYLETKIAVKEGDVAEVLAMLKESVKRADKIINSLLDFSRATSIGLQPEDISLIIENSLNLVKNHPAFNNIEIIKQVSPDMPKVLVDKNKMEQVLINLLINAFQSMPSGGRLTIRGYDKKLEIVRSGIGNRATDNFRPQERAAIVEIEDTGSGISQEQMDKIFDPFFTTKGPRGGAGLGLSVSRNILHMHKGLIFVESQVGKGTKITIILKLSGR